jgi:hypothetical protein
VGATVRVDSRVFQAPLPEVVFVDPGDREIVVEAPGHVRHRERVRIDPGDSVPLRILLVRQESAPVVVNVPQTEAAASEPQSSPAFAGGHAEAPSARKPVLLTGVALTAASAAFSGMSFYMSNSYRDDAFATRDDIANSDHSTCYQPKADVAEQCADMNSSIDNYRTWRTTGQVGAVAAGAFGVSTLAIWLLWPENRSEYSASIRPNSQGVSVDVSANW